MERPRKTRRVGPPHYAVIACVVAAAIWQGCTVTKENYATLSFYFDGVPDPNGKNATIDKRTGEVREHGTLSVHRPYEQEKCNECHIGVDPLTRNSSSVCLKCHEKVTTQHERMHGPVAAVACLWCHNPHESLHPNLLRDDPRKVCMQCHSQSTLEQTSQAAHADKTRQCLECHDGHGGPKPYMLIKDALPGAVTPKAAPEKQPPAAAPATEGSGTPTIPPAAPGPNTGGR